MLHAPGPRQRFGGAAVLALLHSSRWRPRMKLGGEQGRFLLLRCLACTCWRWQEAGELAEMLRRWWRHVSVGAWLRRRQLHFSWAFAGWHWCWGRRLAWPVLPRDWWWCVSRAMVLSRHWHWHWHQHAGVKGEGPNNQHEVECGGRGGGRACQRGEAQW